MMGGDLLKSDSFPSSVQYRLDFSNTERGKKETVVVMEFKISAKKNIIIESYLFSFSYRHMFSSSLLPIRTKAFLSWPHSPHDYHNPAQKQWLCLQWCFSLWHITIYTSIWDLLLHTLPAAGIPTPLFFVNGTSL